MSVAGRIAAVLVASALYSVLFLIVAIAVESAKTWNEPSGSGAFFDSLDSAREDGEARACGYQPPMFREIHLTHDDIVEMAECFERRGYLSDVGLDAIRSDYFEYSYSTDGGVATTIATLSVEPVPRWILLLWLGGLLTVIWLVGFGRPWRRRSRLT